MPHDSANFFGSPPAESDLTESQEQQRAVQLTREQAIWDHIDNQFKFTIDSINENSAPFFTSEPKRLSDLQKLAGGAILASFTLMKAFETLPSTFGKAFLLLAWLFFLGSLILTMTSSSLLTNVQLVRPRLYNHRGAIQIELAAIDNLDQRELRMYELVWDTITRADEQTESALQVYRRCANASYRSFLIGAVFFVFYAMASLF